MKRRNSESLGDVLRQFIRESNLESKIFEQQILVAWPEVVGDGMAAYTSRLIIRNHVLYVYLTSAVVRNELLLRRSTIIAALNQKVGAEVLENIVFR
jgi:predicted nucleic acid-binding Zn ribbon protein